MVTPDIVSDVLHILKVAHPDYPGCDRLRTVSKDELISTFYKCPLDWGDHQFTPCSTFAKGPRFLNMVMTFVLHLLSHYNSITEPRAQFLLSLLKHLTIDFSSHFILSILNIYKDTTSRDKLIFPSAITRILRHFFVPFPVSDHFHVPLTSLPLNEARRSFIWGGPAQQLLPLLQLYPPPLPLVLREVWLWMWSWHSFSAWMLALIHSLLNCIRWTLVSAILLDGRLALVALWSLPLLLPRHPRHLRTMMTSTTIMMMRMEMLALPAMMRYLLDTLTLYHLWQKKRE